MKTVLVVPHKADKSHYHAKETLVSCIDARFAELRQAYLTEQNYGLRDFDPIIIPGGAKKLADNNTEALADVAVSLRLHEAKRISLWVHTSCGAYGRGSEVETAEEREYLMGQLVLAANNLEEYLLRNSQPIPEIKLFLAADAGLYEVIPEAEEAMA